MGPATCFLIGSPFWVTRDPKSRVGLHNGPAYGIPYPVYWSHVMSRRIM